MLEFDEWADSPIGKSFSEGNARVKYQLSGIWGNIGLV
jgi:hypothetical protein